VVGKQFVAAGYHEPLVAKIEKSEFGQSPTAKWAAKCFGTSLR